jgi:hypothetical protein
MADLVRLRAEAIEVSARDLALRLRERREQSWSRRLLEFVPSGLAGDDEHLPGLLAVIAAIQDEQSLEISLREVAGSVAAAITDLPSRIGRGGTVFGTWMLPDSPESVGGYDVHWDAHEWTDLESPWGFVERSAIIGTLNDVLSWASRRSDQVIVRPAWDDSVHYWAGDPGSWPGNLPKLGQ